MAVTTSSTVYAHRTASVLDYNAPHAFSLWAMRTAGAAGASAVLCILNSLYQREDLLEMLSSTNVGAVAVYVGGTGFALSPQYTMPLNTWVYLAGVRESVTTFKLYAGDETNAATLIGTATLDITGRTAATMITAGARRDDGTNPFVGKIDSLNLWTTSLNSTEVETQRLFQDAQLTANLWAQIPLQTDGLDTSGNSRDFTIAGSPSYSAGPDINRGASTASVDEVGAGIDTPTGVYTGTRTDTATATDTTASVYVGAHVDATTGVDVVSGGLSVSSVDTTLAGDSTIGTFVSTLTDAGAVLDTSTAQYTAGLVDTLISVEAVLAVFTWVITDIAQATEASFGAITTSFSEVSFGFDAAITEDGVFEQVLDFGSGADLAAGQYFVQLSETSTIADQALGLDNSLLVDAALSSDLITPALAFTNNDLSLTQDELTASSTSIVSDVINWAEVLSGLDWLTVSDVGVGTDIVFAGPAPDIIPNSLWASIEFTRSIASLTALPVTALLTTKQVRVDISQQLLSAVLSNRQPIASLRKL